MADQTESYGAESKFTGFNCSPFKLTIVGIDCPITDDVKDLADDPDRLIASQKLDPAMVESMLDVGVLDEVSVRKIRGRSETFVVDGRRRVLHARAAEKQRKANKDDVPILVPCVPEKRADLLSSMVMRNRYRQEDSPLTSARLAERMRSRGLSEEQIARRMGGVTKATLEQWRTLLEGSPEALKAVEQGKAVAADVVKEVRQARKEKRAQKAPKERAPKERTQLPIKVIRAMHEAFTPAEGDESDHVSDMVLAVLAFVLGEDPEAKKLRAFEGSETAVKLLRKVRTEASAAK